MSAFARPTNRLTAASCAAGSSRHPTPGAGPRGRTIEAYCRARPRSARSVLSTCRKMSSAIRFLPPSVKGASFNTLAKVLKDAPFTEGGKKRIVEDIFRQVDNTLRADRGLARQYASIVRPRGPAQGAGWRLDPAAQDAVVSLLVGRAKALIPAVAKQ